MRAGVDRQLAWWRVSSAIIIEGSAAPEIKKVGMSSGPHNTPPPNVAPRTLSFKVKSPLGGFQLRFAPAFQTAER